MPRFRRFPALLCGAILLGQGAHAHAPLPGAEGLASGLVQPILEPVQGLLAATLGLVLARAPTGAQPLAWAIYLAALLAGTLIAWGFGGGEATLAALGLIVLFGGGVAAQASTTRAPAMAAALSGGLVAGLAALPDLSPMARGLLPTTLGSLAGALLMTLYLAGAASWSLRRSHRHMAFALAPRILGAWAAAAAILLVAFELRVR